MKFLFRLCSGVLLFISFLPKIIAQEISIENLKTHISYLSSDELNGRGTGTQDEKKAAGYLVKNFTELSLLPYGSHKTYLYDFSFRLKNNPHGEEKSEDTTAKEINSANVAGFLDNGASQTVIIGAHYDHLGLGEISGSLEPESKGKIHNGADDNASGTAGMLELARYYSQNNIKEPYNFLFMAFSGEELGLFGSKKYCENPTIDLKTIHFMLNFDMIGRLDPKEKKVMVYGVGTSPVFINLLSSVKTNLILKTDSAGIGPSDQTSFYLKDIPVLHFFTGQHSDYHKPSDDAEKINYEGEKNVLEFSIQVVNELLKLPKLEFLKTRNSEENKISFKVTLGIMPDYMYDGKGVKIDGVSKDKPAEKAGLLKGDIITQLGDFQVSDMNEYMKILGKFNKGDSTHVSVTREGKLSRYLLIF